MSEHGDARAVGNRLRIRARHGWIARVVEQDEFDRPSVDATLGVHLIDCKLRRDQAFRPGRGGRARQRISERDANRLRARPEDGGPGDSKRQGDARNNGKPHYGPLLHRRSLHRSASAEILQIEASEIAAAESVFQARPVATGKIWAAGRGLGHSHTRPDTARIRRMARNGLFSPWSAADEAFEGHGPDRSIWDERMTRTTCPRSRAALFGCVTAVRCVAGESVASGATAVI